MRVSVVAHPNAKQPRVEKDAQGTLHVYVRQPAVDGKATAAVSAALAEYYGVRKSAVSLVAGATSRHKVFEVAVEEDARK